MVFTLSAAAHRNLEQAMAEGNNTLDFLRSQGYIRMDPAGEISTRQLYDLYRDWCQDNAASPLS